MSAERPTVDPVAVLDSLRKHVATVDRQGTILAVNRAWREFGMGHGTGQTQPDSVGVNYLDLCGRAATMPEPAQAESARAAQAGLAAVLEGTAPHFELEYPCHGPDGAQWFLMRASPLSGAQGGAVVTHEDITVRWKLEQERAVLVAELMAANRELTDFAYVVSHDLKAPLRGISSLASWLAADCSDALGPQGREHVGLIASRVKRLAALIDAILAYSRVGRVREEPSVVALDALVHNTIDLLAPPPHIQVTVAGTLPSVRLEAVKIQQVFQNLLSNAIDFMDKPNGRVVVDGARDGAFWHFRVTDNGPGIAPRHVERIFQMFQTLASRDQFERTGIGLALVKKIVEQQHGSVWVESTVGVGSSFHFTLPVAEPDDRA